MADPPARPPRRSTGTGVLFIAALLCGLVVGVVLRQVTLGFLAGAAVGAVIMIAVWMHDRRD